MTELMSGWVVCPPADTPEKDEPYYYGVKQGLVDYKLYIVSGCCGATMGTVDRIGTSALCSACSRPFPISPHTGFRGEDEPFQLYWGQFSWDLVEERMQAWIDFYFNLKKDGEVEIQFNGTDWNTYLDKDRDKY